MESFQIWSFSGPYFLVFCANTGKYEPEKTPYLDTFHAVRHSLIQRRLCSYRVAGRYTDLSLITFELLQDNRGLPDKKILDIKLSSKIKCFLVGTICKICQNYSILDESSK